jgi:CMP-N-acetylneuraminic acid synthetase
MRPPEASNAGSRIEEALLHVLGAVGAAGYAPDLVVTLQPTVPVRRLDLIDACVAHLALRPKLNSVVSVYRVGVVWERFKDALFPPYRWRNQYGGEIPQRQGVSLEDERFVEDGAVFVTRTAALVATNDRRSAPSEPFVGERTVDIDTEEDLLLADALLRARLGKGEAVA